MRQLRLFDMRIEKVNRWTVGSAGELVAYDLLERAGYEVARIGRGDKRGDLLAIDKDTGEMWRIEVKTSRNTGRGWRFSLFKAGHTDCRHADVVMLLAVLKNGKCVPFVIPVSAVGNRKTIEFRREPKDYTGQWAAYRQKPHELTLERAGQNHA